MASKESARTDGYKRGLEGKGSPSSWGSAAGDSLVNESGSSSERSSGYQEGCRDRARISAEKGSSGSNSSSK